MHFHLRNKLSVQRKRNEISLKQRQISTKYMQNIASNEISASKFVLRNSKCEDQVHAGQKLKIPKHNEEE